MDVVPGKPEHNVKKMLDMISRAKDKSADLIAFPELCISGYLISDKWYDDAFCHDMMAYNDVIRDASQGISIAYGNIFVDDDINARIGDEHPHPNKDGRTRKYNTAVIVQNGEFARRKSAVKLLPEGHQPKTLFPNYRFFDDERYFYSLHEIATDFGVKLTTLAQPYLINVKGREIPVGFEICEDLWCKDYREELSAMNITKHLINNGAELVINLSASPWTIGKHSARDRRLLFLKEEVGDQFVPFVYVNNVGAQNNGKNIITFDGGSSVYNQNGQPSLINKSRFKEELFFTEAANLTTLDHRPKVDHIEQKYEAIRTGIRHIRDMNGWDDHPKFLVGLSGGVDSALSAALVSSVVGPDNVLTVNMPSVYNSSKTIAAADHVAQKLGIQHLNIPIDSIVEPQQQLFNSLDRQLESPKWMRDLSDENIQAKTRGTSILSNVAGRYGYMFTNNGNKLEIALGYVTLYGDVGGAVAPIGDLTKSEVFEMARLINRMKGQSIIPESLLPDELFRFAADQIIPSAELKDEQIDPMKFGYHCAVLTAMTRFIRVTPEDLCTWFLQGSLHSNLEIPLNLIERWGVDDPKTFIEDLEWFSSSIQKSVFKRIQAPPVIVSSTSAYGYDIRETQMPHYRTRKFIELKGQVLKSGQYQPTS
jgi:NAD+ synthase (glutamine-hydrolysing)